MHEICLVVPCYNEERRLRTGSILEYLSSRRDASLCFVNDGSSDGTRSALEALRSSCPGRIRVLNLARNSGKAEAVRQGVLHVKASLPRLAFIGYWDADLSTPFSEVDALLAALDLEPERLIALGSRVKRLGSNIDRRATRHYLGRIFSTVSSRLLDLPVYDSQCGAKLFRAEIVEILFQDPFVTQWLFDVEILVRLRAHLGAEALLRAAVEVPLTSWREVDGSKLRASDVAKVPMELLRIRFRYTKP